jgi:ABC-type multidrug transport system fused ATPase/permease subunit
VSTLTQTFVTEVMVFVVYFLILRYYRGAGADLQRLDAVSRSPIASSLSESLDGTTTINAFDKSNHFAHLFQHFINNNSSAMLNFVASRRWLAVRLDLLGACVTLCASLCITVFSDQLNLSPGLAGFFFMWGSSKYCSHYFIVSCSDNAKSHNLDVFLSFSNPHHVCLFHQWSDRS